MGKPSSRARRARIALAARLYALEHRVSALEADLAEVFDWYKRELAHRAGR